MLRRASPSSGVVPFRFLLAVEPAVEGQDPPSGGGARVYAHPGQGGVDAELAELGVLLLAPYGLDRAQVDLADAVKPAVGPVVEPLLAFAIPLFRTR